MTPCFGQMQVPCFRVPGMGPRMHCLFPILTCMRTQTYYLLFSFSRWNVITSFTSNITGTRFCTGQGCSKRNKIRCLNKHGIFILLLAHHVRFLFFGAKNKCFTYSPVFGNVHTVFKRVMAYKKVTCVLYVLWMYI